MGLTTRLATAWKGVFARPCAPPISVPASDVVTVRWLIHDVVEVTDRGWQFHAHLLQRNGGIGKLLQATHRELIAMIKAAEAAADQQRLQLQQVVVVSANFLDEYMWRKYQFATGGAPAYGLHDLRHWFRSEYGQGIYCEIVAIGRELTIRFGDRQPRKKCVVIITSTPARSPAHVTAPSDSRPQPARRSSR